jgi:hypothetical protein
MRDNFNKFGGCNKKYDDPDSTDANNPPQKSGKDLVKAGYKDAVKLAGKIDPFLFEILPGDNGGTELEFGVLETRYLGNVNEAGGYERKTQIRSKKTFP